MFKKLYDCKIFFELFVVAVIVLGNQASLIAGPGMKLSQTKFEILIDLNGYTSISFDVTNTGHHDLDIYRDTIPNSGNLTFSIPIGWHEDDYEYFHPIPNFDVTLAPGDSQHCVITFHCRTPGTRHNTIELAHNIDDDTSEYYKQDKIEVTTHTGLAYLEEFEGSLSLSWPAIAGDGTIYFVETLSYNKRYALIALEPDSVVKWSLEFEVPDSYYSRKETLYPVLAEDGTIYVHFDKLYAVSPQGNIKWTFDRSSNVNPILGTDNTIYFGNDNYGSTMEDPVNPGLYAVNPDGTQRWHNPDLGIYRLTAGINTFYTYGNVKVNLDGSVVYEDSVT